MVIEKQKYKNLKNKGIKMEDIVKDHEYSITIGFPEMRDSEVVKCNELHIYPNLIKTLDSQIRALRKLKHCEVVLSPELSPTGHLHFHGLIKIRDVLKFYWRDLYILNQYQYEIDVINDVDKWNDYINKQMAIWVPAFDSENYDYPIMINRKK